MQKVKFGDVLEVKKGFIVHGCNNCGVMGSGVAAQIKKFYPTAYKAYMQKHEDQELLLGSVDIVRVAPSLHIVNAVTQNGYGRDGQKYVSYKAIGSCFASIFNEAVNLELPVHYPLIGAGLGGGHWSIISQIIESEAQKVEKITHIEVDRTLWIYE